MLRAENCRYYKDQGWEVEQRIVTRVRKMGELLKDSATVLYQTKPTVSKTPPRQSDSNEKN